MEFGFGSTHHSEIQMPSSRLVSVGRRDMDEREGKIFDAEELSCLKTCAHGSINWKRPDCWRGSPNRSIRARRWARCSGRRAIAALLFENLPGYPGWRCLGQAPGDVSLAPVAFDTPRDEMIPEFVRRTEKLGTTRLVETGPVQQKVMLGDEVDITKMPIHQAGIRDGGPFIGSGLMITKNPETGRRNLSFHRLQMKGPKKTGILLYPRHAWTNYQMYEAQDKPMPVAIMIGHHPMYYFAAATTTQYGVDELEIASALLQEDVELVKCRTVDLEVPAWAEIILEGEIPPKVQRARRAVQRISGLLSHRLGHESDRQHQSRDDAQRRDFQERPERH